MPIGGGVMTTDDKRQREVLAAEYILSLKETRQFRRTYWYAVMFGEDGNPTGEHIPASREQWVRDASRNADCEIMQGRRAQIFDASIAALRRERQQEVSTCAR